MQIFRIEYANVTLEGNKGDRIPHCLSHKKRTEQTMNLLQMFQFRITKTNGTFGISKKGLTAKAAVFARANPFNAD